MGPRLRLLLIVSIVLNVFLLGAIGGGLYRWRDALGFGARGWRGHVAEALAPDNARAFRHAVRETVRDARPLAIEARAARADAADLFVRDRFDAAAVSAALARARTADVALRQRIEDRVVAFAATLPLPERRAMAEALRRGPLRQPRARTDGTATRGR